MELKTLIPVFWGHPVRNKKPLVSCLYQGKGKLTSNPLSVSRKGEPLIPCLYLGNGKLTFNPLSVSRKGETKTFILQ